MKKVHVKEYLKDNAENILHSVMVGLLCGASCWLGYKYALHSTALGLWMIGQEDPEFDSHMMAAFERMKEIGY